MASKDNDFNPQQGIKESNKLLKQIVQRFDDSVAARKQETQMLASVRASFTDDMRKSMADLLASREFSENPAYAKQIAILQQYTEREAAAKQRVDKMKDRNGFDTMSIFDVLNPKRWQEAVDQFRSANNTTLVGQLMAEMRTRTGSAPIDQKVMLKAHSAFQTGQAKDIVNQFKGILNRDNDDGNVPKKSKKKKNNQPDTDNVISKELTHKDASSKHDQNNVSRSIDKLSTVVENQSANEPKLTVPAETLDPVNNTLLSIDSGINQQTKMIEKLEANQLAATKEVQDVKVNNLDTFKTGIDTSAIAKGLSTQRKQIAAAIHETTSPLIARVTKFLAPSKGKDQQYSVEEKVEAKQVETKKVDILKNLSHDIKSILSITSKGNANGAVFNTSSNTDTVNSGLGLEDIATGGLIAGVFAKIKKGVEKLPKLLTQGLSSATAMAGNAVNKLKDVGKVISKKVPDVLTTAKPYTEKAVDATKNLISKIPGIDSLKNINIKENINKALSSDFVTTAKDKFKSFAVQATKAVKNSEFLKTKQGKGLAAGAALLSAIGVSKLFGEDKQSVQTPSATETEDDSLQKNLAARNQAPKFKTEHEYAVDNYLAKMRGEIAQEQRFGSTTKVLTKNGSIGKGEYERRYENELKMLAKMDQYKHLTAEELQRKANRNVYTGHDAANQIDIQKKRLRRVAAIKDEEALKSFNDHERNRFAQMGKTYQDKTMADIEHAKKELAVMNTAQYQEKVHNELMEKQRAFEENSIKSKEKGRKHIIQTFNEDKTKVVGETVIKDGKILYQVDDSQNIDYEKGFTVRSQSSSIHEDLLKNLGKEDAIKYGLYEKEFKQTGKVDQASFKPGEQVEAEIDATRSKPMVATHQEVEKTESAEKVEKPEEEHTMFDSLLNAIGYAKYNGKTTKLNTFAPTSANVLTTQNTKTIAGSISDIFGQIKTSNIPKPVVDIAGKASGGLAAAYNVGMAAYNINSDFDKINDRLAKNEINADQAENLKVEAVAERSTKAMTVAGGALAGAKGGALLGASLGSVIPGVGTLVGTGIGGLLGSIVGAFGATELTKSDTGKGIIDDVKKTAVEVWDWFKEDKKVDKSITPVINEQQGNRILNTASAQQEPPNINVNVNTQNNNTTNNVRGNSQPAGNISATDDLSSARRYAYNASSVPSY